MTEGWRPAPHYPCYEISSFGRVRRGERILTTHTHHGYVRVQLWRDGKPSSVRISRLVCEAFNGPPGSPELVVEHINHDKANNSPENLRWTTQRENLDRSVADGVVAHGERIGRSRLTKEAVAEILATPRYYGCVRDLARKFGVAPQTINHVRAGLTWGREWQSRRAAA